MKMKPMDCPDVRYTLSETDMSLKGDERFRRETGARAVEFVPNDNMKLPGWNAFISNPKNKASLLSYISSCWAKSPLPDGIS